MKKQLLNTLLLVFISTNVFAQKTEVTKVIYNFQVSGEYSQTTVDAHLYFNNEKSFFVYDRTLKKEETSLTGKDNGTLYKKIDRRDNIGRYQYINFSKKQINERRMVNGKKYVTLEDKLQNIDWEFLKDTKVIGDYTCHLAKGWLFGRTFFAWYAPKIPSSKGPWKLHGLPGLILEAKSEDELLAFTLKELSFKQEFDFSTINTSGEKYTLKEYYIADKKAWEKYVNFIKAKVADANAKDGGSATVEIKRTNIVYEIIDFE